jgi:hypothetical protein
MAVAFRRFADQGQKVAHWPSGELPISSKTKFYFVSSWAAEDAGLGLGFSQHRNTHRLRTRTSSYPVLEPPLGLSVDLVSRASRIMMLASAVCRYLSYHCRRHGGAMLPRRYQITPLLFLRSSSVFLSWLPFPAQDIPARLADSSISGLTPVALPARQESN